MIIKENKYLIFDNEKRINLVTIVKYVVNFLQRFVYNILFVFLKPNRNIKNKYSVSICAIFKNEADYIKEWLEYQTSKGYSAWTINLEAKALGKLYQISP